MSVASARLECHSLMMRCFACIALRGTVFTCDEDAFQTATQRVYAGSCLKVLTMP